MSKFRNPRQRGFSLIELMVVVAIIGVLAAVAIPAYRGYIEQSNMTKVNTHYEQGVAYVEAELRRVQAQVTLGTQTLAGADTDYTAADWAGLLNDQGGSAPNGGAPYAGAVNDAGGVVGVAIAGGFASGDLVVTITRPQYGDFGAANQEVRWDEL